MCAIELCELPIKARGWCHRHLRRFYRYGNPLGTPKFKKYEHFPCSVEKCSKPVQARELCQKHYRRWSLYGNPNIKKRDSDYRSDSSYKYSIAYGHPNANANGKIPEHRLVMSQILGRALVEGENVHHKNGNRKDNRPENLELWNTYQPAGQKPEDKIEYAVGILSLYAPEFLDRAKLPKEMRK